MTGGWLGDGLGRTYHILGLTDDVGVATSDVDWGFLTRSSHGSTWGREYQNKRLLDRPGPRVVTVWGRPGPSQVLTDPCWETGDATLPQSRLRGHRHSRH